MRFLARSLSGLFLLALTVGLLAWGGNSVWSALKAKWAEETIARPARERVIAVNVLTVAADTVQPVITAFGEVRSRRTLDLRAAAAGQIVDLAPNVVEGGEVTAGAVLMQIDPVNAESALELARTDLAEAEADLREAERALILARDEQRAAEDQARLRDQAKARQQNLLERGVGTEAALETAALAASAAEQAVLAKRQAVAQAEARIDQASNAVSRRTLALAEAERRLADTRLVAEFAGTLSGVGVVQGGIVTQNERIATLIDTAALEVSFRLSTSQYARLLDARGRLLPVPVTARLDLFGVDLAASGTISREGAAVGAGQTGRLIFATLDPRSAAGFRPGDFVTVAIAEPPLEGVAVLPATAVDSQGRVLLVGEGERLEERAVDVVRRQRNDVLIRAEGVIGREVVAERSPLLGAGIKVRPIRRESLPPGDAAAAAAAMAPAEPEMVELTPERRARLIAYVEKNGGMPADVKRRLLAQLNAERVPAQMVDRIESRIGG